MATEVIKTIKPGGGGDYVTLGAWESARRGNIVTRDTIEIAECYGGDVTGGANVSMAAANWTTDATHYVVIRAASGQGHAGVWDVSKATFGAGAGGTFNPQIGYVYVQGMQFKLVAGASQVNANNQAGIVYVDRCLFNGGGGYVVHNSSGAGTGEVKVTSCIGYGGNGKAINPATAATKITVYGCTFSTSDDCIFVGNAGAICIEDDNYWKPGAGKAVYYNPFSGTMTKGSYTMTSNTEAVTVAYRSIAFDANNFTNVTGGSENLLLPVGSALIGMGQTIAALTSDILNVARVAGYYDVGAHNPSAPPSGGPVLFVMGF